MISTDDPPKLPKWAFLLGDATLLATAAWIAAKTPHPTTGASLVAIVTCVALAAVCGVIPFLAEYGRQQDVILAERERALAALAETVETCAEQISIAARSLQRFTDLATNQAERVDAAIAVLETKAKAVAGNVATRPIEPPAAQETPRAAPAPIAKVVPFESPVPPPVIEFMPASADQPGELPLSVPGSAAADPAADPTASPVEAAVPPVPRKRTPKKAPPASPAPMESTELAEAAAPTPPSPAPLPAAAPLAPPAPVAPPAPDALPAQVPPPAPPRPSEPDREIEPAASAPSADGTTRLLVTAYIGIGNRLFIRGEGPGLSWERGVPLQFVSIGKWRWETAEASAPVTFRLYKNDETECTSLGRQSLAPGRQQELRATF
jgi:hypothetical protein